MAGLVVVAKVGVVVFEGAWPGVVVARVRPHVAAVAGHAGGGAGGVLGEGGAGGVVHVQTRATVEVLGLRLASHLYCWTDHVEFIICTKICLLNKTLKICFERGCYGCNLWLMFKLFMQHFDSLGQNSKIHFSIFSIILSLHFYSD